MEEYNSKPAEIVSHFIYQAVEQVERLSFIPIDEEDEKRVQAMIYQPCSPVKQYLINHVSGDGNE